jgi:hypothetical protein
MDASGGGRNTDRGLTGAAGFAFNAEIAEKIFRGVRPELIYPVFVADSGGFRE